MAVKPIDIYADDYDDGREQSPGSVVQYQNPYTPPKPQQQQQQYTPPPQPSPMLNPGGGVAMDPLAFSTGGGGAGTPWQTPMFGPPDESNLIWDDIQGTYVMGNGEAYTGSANQNPAAYPPPAQPAPFVPPQQPIAPPPPVYNPAPPGASAAPDPRPERIIPQDPWEALYGDQGAQKKSEWTDYATQTGQDVNANPATAAWTQYSPLSGMTEDQKRLYWAGQGTQGLAGLPGYNPNPDGSYNAGSNQTATDDYLKQNADAIKQLTDQVQGAQSGALDTYNDLNRETNYNQAITDAETQLQSIYNSGGVTQDNYDQAGGGEHNGFYDELPTEAEWLTDHLGMSGFNPDGTYNDATINGGEGVYTPFHPEDAGSYNPGGNGNPDGSGGDGFPIDPPPPAVGVDAGGGNGSGGPKPVGPFDPGSGGGSSGGGGGDPIMVNPPIFTDGGGGGGGGQTLPPPGPNTPDPGASGPLGPTLTPVDPQRDLRALQINPGSILDRFKLAQQQYGSFADATSSQYQAALRDATRHAAGAGRLGSGMLRTSYGDLANERGRALDTSRDTLFQNALLGSVNDAQNQFDNYLKEQQYQTGAQGQAFNQAVTGAQLQEQLTNGSFQRALAQLIQGQSNDPSSLQMQLSNIFGNQANSANTGLAALMQGLAAGGSGSNSTQLQQLLQLLSQGKQAIA